MPYTADAGYHGPDAATLRVSDGNGAYQDVAITINVVANLAPSAMLGYVGPPPAQVSIARTQPAALTPAPVIAQRKRSALPAVDRARIALRALQVRLLGRVGWIADVYAARGKAPRRIAVACVVACTIRHGAHRYASGPGDARVIRVGKVRTLTLKIAATGLPAVRASIRLRH